jgi:hypothetical protein
MSKIKYPATMWTDDGMAILFRGHGLDPFEVEAEVMQGLGNFPGYEVHVTEEHYTYVPRIKHCSRWDGWGCDQDGEDFHGHWFAIKPTDDPRNQFTQALQVRVA